MQTDGLDHPPRRTAGDQGRLDADGYVVITGRIKELINKGGEKISPIELDNVLARHPAVAEAVSFAVPDELYGQEVGVAVVLRPGERLAEDDLRSWASERLAKFKIPKKVGSWFFSFTFFLFTTSSLLLLSLVSMTDTGC